MATFPADPIPTSSDDITVKPLITSESNGYIQQRPKTTRNIKKFKLNYNILNDTQKTTLENFFINNNGLEFTYVYPKTGTSYTMIFDGMDEISFSFDAKMNKHTTTINLREK